MSKQKINIYWFKRDLRLNDNQCLENALKEGIPLALVYIFEPELLSDPHWDQRHSSFIFQSLRSISEQLPPGQSAPTVFEGSVEDVFDSVCEKFEISKVFSHEEIGIDTTFKRDKRLKSFFRHRGINWQELPFPGIRRGSENRKGWSYHFNSSLQGQCRQIDLALLSELLVELEVPEPLLPSAELLIEDTAFQIGGEHQAHRQLQSFLSSGAKDYNKSLGSPSLSRKNCSRLSPYLAWGNLSSRQVHQASQNALQNGASPRDLRSFLSRLAWRSHFMQKFEIDCRIEYENMNPAFDSLRQDWNEEFYERWESGSTGFPLIDASIRCVRQTGYLNFRMRAALVSFLTHLLWLDWRRGAAFLARQFLDFEPGIHFSQFQMQSGVTGINTIRVYNPVKQSQEKDPNAEFILEWCPELSGLPREFIHLPSAMTPMEEVFHNFKLGERYPRAVVEHSEAYRAANKSLWAVKKSAYARRHSRQILAKHVESPNRRRA